MKKRNYRKTTIIKRNYGNSPTTKKRYYGKPTKTKGHPFLNFMFALFTIYFGFKVGGFWVGLLAIILAAIYLNRDDREDITRTCLKCGGTGHVTAITDAYIGFQCNKCLNSWKERNRNKLKASDVEH